MAIYKDKTGRGEADFNKPAQTFNGREIFLNDGPPSQFVQPHGSSFAPRSQPFQTRYFGGSFGVKSHLCFQLRGEPFGTSDVSGNGFTTLEYSGSLTKRLENVTHRQKLKSFEFKDNKILTLTASADNIQGQGIAGGGGFIFRFDVGEPAPIIDNETILPYNDFGTGGTETAILAGWIYVEDYSTNGGCIMEQVEEGTEKRTFGLILTEQGELTWRHYNPTQAFVNNFGNQFQQITTVKKLEKKTWYHFCIIMKGNGPAGFGIDKQFNNSGLDNPHQNHSYLAPAYTQGPQVAIFINGEKQEVTQANASSMTAYAWTSSGTNFPIVFGRGLGDYDSGSGGSIAKDTFFQGRLAEVNWHLMFGPDFVALHLMGIGVTGPSATSPTAIIDPIAWRRLIAQLLMDATKNITSGVSNVSERLLLKDADSDKTYHPTVKRPGDHRRLGNNKIFFNDGIAQTLSGSVVHYPTKLVKDDALKDSIYNGYIDGDLHIDGAIPSTDIYDTHYVREDRVSHEPFVETRLNISDSSFYETGTLDSVIPGFDRHLKNKDVIEIELGHARLGIQDFAGNVPNTGSAGEIGSSRNSLDFTYHLPTMFYFNGNSKEFEPLSNATGNFGGIKNSSSNSVVTAASGSKVAQTRQIMKELRLGFAPFKGQPITFSEQFATTNEHPTLGAQDLGYGQGGGNNNRRGGIKPQFTASMAMPSDGDQIGFFFTKRDSTGDGLADLTGDVQEVYFNENFVVGVQNSGHYIAGPDADTTNSNATARKFVDPNDIDKFFNVIDPISTKVIHFVGSHNLTPTAFRGNFKTTHSGSDVFNSVTDFRSSQDRVDLGINGKSLATIVSEVAALVGTLGRIEVSSTSPTGFNFHREDATERHITLRSSITYSGFSLETVDGKSEVSALQLVGDGMFTNIGGPTSDFGFPWSPKYHQETDDCVDLAEYITEPFLAEKIEVNFKVKASTGYARESSYYVFTNEAPNKYIPKYVTPLAGSSAVNFSTLASAGYPPAAAKESYVPEHSVGSELATFANIQYAFDGTLAEEGQDGYYFIDTEPGQNNLLSSIRFDDYHFFILKQDRKNISQMDLARKGPDTVVHDKQQSTFNIDLKLGDGGFVDGAFRPASFPSSSLATNRELLHHSKILVYTEKASMSQGMPGESIQNQRRDLILNSISGSFDLLIPTSGYLFEGSSTVGYNYRHVPSNNFVPAFDLPYSGSNIGRFVESGNAHDIDAQKTHMKFQTNSSVTGSFTIRKPLETQQQYNETYALFFGHHPNFSELSFSADNPNTMIRLSNTLGGYQQSEAVGSRAFGPGNIAALDGTSKSYVTVQSFDRTTRSQITSSIEVKQPVDFGSTPTLLFPEDKLIFGFQNAINAFQAMMPFGFKKGVFKSNLDHIFTGLEHHSQYDVIQYPHLHMDDISVKIYGSYLRNSQPKNFQLNQLLGTDTIHEAFGSDSVHDQFDLSPRGVFSGSYVDEVMSGSTVSPYSGFNSAVHEHGAGPPPATDFTNLARRVNTRSSEGTHGVTGSLRRTISIASADKTEFDSFLFDLQGLFEVDERSENVPETGDLGRTGNYTNDRSISVGGDGNADTLLIGGDPRTQGIHSTNKNVKPNIDIGASFLNSRYSEVRKVRAPQVGRQSSFFQITVTGSFDTRSLAVPGLIQTSDTGVIGEFGRLFDSDDNAGFEGGSVLSTREVNTLLFTVGDGVSNAHILETRPDPIHGTFTRFVIPTPRGFRYGLSNIVDKKPKNVFRRDRYGQLRDMLEMAPNTAYIDDKSNTVSFPIEAQFFADDGSISAPDQTSCSNLSTNCTSSAPYFDRDVEVFDDPVVIRNRGPLNNQIADITIEI